MRNQKSCWKKYKSLYERGCYPVTFDEKMNKVVKEVSLGTKVLDVGCGPGIIAEKLIQKGCEVIGVDIAMSTARLPANKGIPVIVAAGEALPFRDDMFERVVMSEILEHVFSPDRLLEEAKRVLMLEGDLIVCVPNTCSLMNRIRVMFGRLPRAITHPGHIKAFSLRSLKGELRRKGFRVTGATSTFYGLPLAEDFFSRFFPSLGGHLIVKAKKGADGL